MSNLNEYALIIATFISGTFLITQLTRLQNEAAADVIVGVMQGVPLSTEIRWIWLLQVFLSMAISILIVDFFLLVAFIKIAARVDESVALLAYLGAAISGFAFVLQLLFGTSAFFKHVSLLRQAAQR